MELGPDGKPCRACTSVEELMQRAHEYVKKTNGKDKDKAENGSKAESKPSRRGYEQCPPDKDELGRSTWNLLHTMSVYYPEKPTEDQKQTVSVFMDSLAKTYPCDYCARDLRKVLKEDPPKLSSRNEFALWMCQLHNKVNRRTGKPDFDCTKVFERWKDGWKDGSCDY
ncbi:Erv1 / Alr family protein [Teladorsagia circumcincta]|uniref:Sulfhydryl oxidase n=1 Tax=Teladorsagia circumcincta TaxID=45464 RepID=A0A2G9UE35_TELCI|nr:Erv1 / Alr family protein [Teladorsagia circumcincta]